MKFNGHPIEDKIVKTKQKRERELERLLCPPLLLLYSCCWFFYDEIFITVLLETARALVIDLKLLYILFYGKVHYYPLFLNQFPWNLISALSNSIAHDPKLQRMAHLACLVFADMLHPQRHVDYQHFHVVYIIRTHYSFVPGILLINVDVLSMLLIFA